MRTLDNTPDQMFKHLKINMESAVRGEKHIIKSGPGSNLYRNAQGMQLFTSGTKIITKTQVVFSGPCLFRTTHLRHASGRAAFPS